MELIKCGTKATPKLNNTEAFITAISIRFDRVTYELSYFYNGEYKIVWLDESEFDVIQSEKFKIGFK